MKLPRLILDSVRDSTSANTRRCQQNWRGKLLAAVRERTQRVATQLSWQLDNIRLEFFVLCVLLKPTHMQYLKTSLLLFSTAMTGSCMADSTHSYSSSNAAIANPERGFYRYVESRGSSSAQDRRWTLSDFEVPIPWADTIDEQKITLVYCVFYLDSFVDRDIDQRFLNDIDFNLKQVLKSGRKSVVRFAYHSDDSDGDRNGIPDVLEDDEVDTEPPKKQILRHIKQLQPIVQGNSHGIATLQAGFIGIWGEWYYTDHFVDDPAKPGDISDARYADRREVVEAILDAVPAHLQVAVRYPNAKMRMLKTAKPIGRVNAHDGSIRARIAAHNDAFLNSWGDSGTYRYSNGTNSPGKDYSVDRNFLAADSKFLVNGGETSTPGVAEPGYPGRECRITERELATFHWTYMNVDYHESTVQKWQKKGCLGRIFNQLGYRLQLTKSTLSDNVRLGGAIDVSLRLRNTGYAAPINPRPVRLILRAKDKPNREFSIALESDVRFWLPGTDVDVREKATLPPDILPGEYDLYIHLPDASSSLKADPGFAIQLANQGIWDAKTGFNNLKHTVVVTPR